MKIKLAICLKNAIYQERFVKCLMMHYAQAYEFHVFKDISEIEENGLKGYDGFILDECSSAELSWNQEQRNRTLLLKDEEKYQEVYRIMETLETLLSNHGMKLPVENVTKPKIIGVYSLVTPALQLPFVTTLNEVIGEKKRTIFLDLQEYSGFDEEGELGLEDMMTMSATGNCVRSRMLTAIGHMQEWDYVIPLKNSRCLMEGNREMFMNLTEQLVLELGYEAIVINLGQIAMNTEGISSICDQIFMLYPKGNVQDWREKRMFEELERKGEQDVLHRIQRMEVPAISGADGDWRKLSEQWKWGSLGNVLRKIVWEETSFG